MSNTNIKSDPINRDVLWGVDEISRCIGREPQATSRMLRLGYLPAFKVGTTTNSAEIGGAARRCPD
jgi:hypothetical protein